MWNCARLPLIALALSQALCVAAYADAPAPPPGPLPHGQKDVTLAPAGNYALDSGHAGIIARVSHLGFSRSIFRFDRVTGTLGWDPKAVAHSTLSVTVETNSIATNVAGFAAELTGVKYLKSVAFPQATFVSIAFRQTDATHGKVDGEFTLMGKTKPMTFDVSLVGAGPFFGRTVIGIHAETSIDPQDFGMSAFFSDPIELVIDSEFDRTP